MRFAGAWGKNQKGWWYSYDAVGYPVNKWEWIDGDQDGVSECYYFDSDGYLLVNTTIPDGYQVNQDDAWTVNGIVQTQETNKTYTGTVSFTNSYNGLSGETGGSSNSLSSGFSGSSRTVEKRAVIDKFKDTYITPNMSDFEMEMSILQYLIETVEYDMDYYESSSASDDAYTSYGVLLDGLAVYDGYSNALEELADACGLNSQIAIGTANGMGYWEDYSWNRVQLDGEWYHVDVIWEANRCAVEERS